MKKMIALGLLFLSAVTAHTQMRLPQCQANAVCPTFAAPSFEILPGGVLIWPDGTTSNSAAQSGSVPAANVTAGTFGSGVLLPAAQVVAGSLGSGVIASSVAAGAVGNAQLAASAVTNAKVAAGTFSNITIPAANVASGSLGSGVIASSLAANGVGAGTYGSATQSAQVAVGVDGRVTSASNVTITGVPAASVPAAGVQAGSLGTAVTVSTANIVPGLNAANELVQFNGSGAYPAADGSLLSYPTAGAGAIPFFTGTGGSLSTNASKLYWDNTNSRLGIRTTLPTHAVQISSGEVYLDGNSPTPIEVGNNGSTMTLTSAGNLTIAGAFSAPSSSITGNAFFGNGYNLTGISVSSCASIPNSAFVNTTFGIALGTVTLTTRGFPIYVSLQSTARGSAGTTVLECTLLVDHAFTSNIGAATVVSERTPTAAADFTFPIPRSQIVQANGTPYPAGVHSVALACLVNSGTGTILLDATHYNQLCATETP